MKKRRKIYRDPVVRHFRRRLEERMKRKDEGAWLVTNPRIRIVESIFLASAFVTGMAVGLLGWVMLKTGF